MELNLDELDLTAAESTTFEKSRRSWLFTSMPLFSLEKVFCDQTPQGGTWGVQGGQNEVPCFQLACYYWPESDEHTPFLRVSVGQAQTVLTMPPMNGGNNPPGPLWGQRVYAASCALVVLEAKQVGPTR